MFKKLHLQLTFFCTLITGIIMVTMSVISIISSELSLKNSHYTSFISEINSMIANLEHQTVISYEWIARMEKSGQYIISISNNGNPLLYEDLQGSGQRTALIERARETAYTEYDFQLSPTKNTSTLTKHVEFVLYKDNRSFQTEQYYVSAAVIPKGQRYLSVLMLYPLDSLYSQIARQRIQYLCLNIIGIFLLFIFSYFFTKRMIEPLQKSREQQTQFVALASHELRTPLSVILSSLSAMKKADETETERFRNAIESEGNRMSRLIQDLLTLASADNSSMEGFSSVERFSSISTHCESLEIDTLLLDVFEKFELLANKKDIHLSIALPEESVPSCMGDYGRLEQVFSILLDNAISYTPQGGTIHISLTRTRTKLEVRVADSGPGIPDEYKEHIWERFYRIDKSHTERKHFGLGLSIAKEIIRSHKGKIWVEDASDKSGTVFIITLPIKA